VFANILPSGMRVRLTTLTGLGAGRQRFQHIAFLERAPESGAAAQGWAEPAICARRLPYEPPVTPLGCRRLRRLQPPACADRPCLVNEEDLVVNNGCRTGSDMQFRLHRQLLSHPTCMVYSEPYDGTGPRLPRISRNRACRRRRKSIVIRGVIAWRCSELSATRRRLVL
jgi:hypothetical protein